MATKTKPRSSDTPKSTDESSDKSNMQIVVRRGALRRFDMMKRKSEDLPVTVTWDRRVGQRRSAAATTDAERRQNDRRKSPPFTWEMADFVLVEPSESAPAAAEPRKKTRK